MAKPISESLKEQQEGETLQDANARLAKVNSELLEANKDLQNKFLTISSKLIMLEKTIEEEKSKTKVIEKKEKDEWVGNHTMNTRSANVPPPDFH